MLINIEKRVHAGSPGKLDGTPILTNGKEPSASLTPVNPLNGGITQPALRIEVHIIPSLQAFQKDLAVQAPDKHAPAPPEPIAAPVVHGETLLRRTGSGTVELVPFQPLRTRKAKEDSTDAGERTHIAHVGAWVDTPAARRDTNPLFTILNETGNDYPSATDASGSPQGTAGTESTTPDLAPGHSGGDDAGGRGPDNLGLSEDGEHEGRGEIRKVGLTQAKRQFSSITNDISQGHRIVFTDRNEPVMIGVRVTQEEFDAAKRRAFGNATFIGSGEFA